MQTFNLEQLKAATLAGGVTGISLRGEGSAFVVRVHTQRGEKPLFRNLLNKDFRKHDWFVNVHAPEVVKQSGLTRFAVERSEKPLVRAPRGVCSSSLRTRGGGWDCSGFRCQALPGMLVIAPAPGPWCLEGHTGARVGACPGGKR